MSIKLIQTLSIVTLIISGYSLHLQQQPRVYEPQRYFSELKVTQDKVKADLLQIQNQFKSLDQSLKQAADDPNLKLRLYEEGIADERDQLYKIKQYLNLPFNERACQCMNFDQKYRASLYEKLAKTRESLTALQQQAQKCSDCQINQQIMKQIQQQKNYYQIMQDILDAKCCKIYKFIYNDNLANISWIYGGLTQEDYNKWNDQQTKKYKTEQSLVRTCPLFSPFAGQKLQKCIKCQKQDQVFNLKTRTCQKCPQKKIFDPTQHRCKFNIPCPDGSKFNQNTMECQRIIPPFNSSICPPNTPVWNPQLRGCFRCDQTTPYFDSNTQRCIPCPDSYTYNQNTNQCYHSSCSPGQTYNEVTKKCQGAQGEPSTSSNSLCPLDRPFWDKLSLSCTRCPSTLPFFDPTLKSCQPCPAGSNFDIAKNACFKTCGPGLQLNTATLQCQNAPKPVITPSGDQSSSCPPTRPNWNPVTKSCEQCPAQLPNWNSQTRICQKCGVGQTLNPTTLACQGNNVQIQCPIGSSYNFITKMCEKQGGTLVHCPEDKPLYNTLLMACTACPINTPYYNARINKCQAAAGGTPSTPSLVTCQPGTFLNPSTQTCVPSTPQNPQGPQVLIQCPTGQAWDNTRKICTDTTTVPQTPQVPTPGLSGTTSRCPVGQTFNPAKLRCQCPQGLNFRYNTEKDVCQEFCKTYEQYDTISGKCVRIA